MPIIVGLLDATSMNFDKNHWELPGLHNSTALIKSALLGGSNIHRRVLGL